ncbi:MAG: molybdopterin cofactor-binding domain-containing protein [Myxococcaceae bacterium]
MTLLQERLRFEPDGTVTAFSGKMELGQGLRAAYARLVAEELGVSCDSVRVVLGETDVTPWDMGTFGSMSVEMDGHELRRAAAWARHVLLNRASQILGCSSDELTLRYGRVSTLAGKASVNLGELVAGAPLEGTIPESVPLASPTPTCPDAPLTLDAQSIVTGSAQFTGDVRLPGMLHGIVLHSPIHGATLRSIDADAARALPGVVTVIHQGDFAAIVAERTPQAIAAIHALKPVWSAPPTSRAEPLMVKMRGDAGVDQALAAGAQRLHACYVVPHVTAMPLGPSFGLVDIRPDGADIYASTQAPFRLREEVARISGLSNVHFHARLMSGGFGRHGAHDAALEAARLSKAVGRPVMVQWNRADELHAAPKRPELVARVDAALDSSGRIIAWRFSGDTNPYTYDGAGEPEGRPSVARGPASPPAAHQPPGSLSGDWSSPEGRVAMMAGRNAVPNYDVGAVQTLLHVRPAAVRTGALRSLGASPNVFAIESMMDELAYAARTDPLAFRLRHTPDARLRRVLETVGERSAWASRPQGSGRGFGVAAVLYRNTYVAEVVEVSVAGDGNVRLEHVWCAVDAGHVVHPNGARNQVEGAVQMAASWTLLEELPLCDNEVTGSTWADYPVATFLDAPRAIDIAFVGEDTTPSAGLGEPPSVPVAPAIANAVFAACGARLRRLPLRAEAVRKTLEEDKGKGTRSTRQGNQ